MSGVLTEDKPLHQKQAILVLMSKSALRAVVANREGIPIIVDI